MLLETRQLTPTQFADAIGIARPIVSHILSGRNKPSLEVVQRILAAMPDLSMPWLLNGTGSMQAAAPVSSVPAEPVLSPGIQDIEKEKVIEKSLPLVAKERARSLVAQEPPPSAAPRPAPPFAANRPGPKRFAAKLSEVEPVPKAVPPAPVPAATVPVPAAPVPVNEPVATPPTAPPPAGSLEATPIAAALLAGTEKPIRRIVIFYRDGSFADYQPE